MTDDGDIQGEYCNMNDEELIKNAAGLHYSIYVAQCYSTKDILRYMEILRVLENRGYNINDDRELCISKDEWENDL